MSGLIHLLSNFGIPTEVVIQWTFYTIAGLTCLFALMVVFSRDIFHSALFLAMTLIGVACVYLYLNAEFLAVVQVLIYVGAIVTLFIFVIMLTANLNVTLTRQVNWHVLFSAVMAFLLVFILIEIIIKSLVLAVQPKTPFLSLEQLGKSLMSNYVLPFEVLSLILLAALVGAIVIGKAERE